MEDGILSIFRKARPSTWALFVLAAVLFAVAKTGVADGATGVTATAAPTASPPVLSIVSGNAQFFLYTTSAKHQFQPLVVKLVDNAGKPLSGYTVQFSASYNTTTGGTCAFSNGTSKDALKTASDGTASEANLWGVSSQNTALICTVQVSTTVAAGVKFTESMSTHQ
jgi:hypothetical protein